MLVSPPVRIVVQRVSRAAVRAGGETVGAIGPGLCALVGAGQGDAPDVPAALAEKVVHLRVFPDAEGKMNRSLLEAGGALLVVSQFTLYGDARKGRRPNFSRAAPGAEAEALVDAFAAAARALGVPVATGRFGALMELELLNDGPVTILLDSERAF
jgi:D-tyrosyl-tRNA(Tyr) deacylase